MSTDDTKRYVMFGDIKLDLDQIVSIILSETDSVEAVSVRVVQRGIPGSYEIKPSGYLSSAPGLFISASKNLVADWCEYKQANSRLANQQPRSAATDQETLTRLSNRLAVLERNYATLRDYLANLELRSK